MNKEVKFAVKEIERGYKYIMTTRQGKQVLLGVYIGMVLEYLAIHPKQFAFWFIAIPTYCFAHKVIFK